MSEPIVTMYAVREAGTDKYLPNLGPRHRSYSFSSPVAHGGKFGPRLHGTQRSAIWAAKAWKRGVYAKEYLDDYGSGPVSVRVDPARADVVLEIVRVDLHEVQ